MKKNFLKKIGVIFFVFCCSVNVYAAEVPTVEVTPDTYLTSEERVLIAKMCVAEAEGESEEGKRLVIDTILNRVDHESFSNTVEGVLYEPGQFSSINNGRFDKAKASSDILNLVIEEELTRSNEEVIFFQTGSYSKYGDPLLKEGHHYFNSLERR